jgi:uncharacterized protein (DUF1786 family)
VIEVDQKVAAVAPVGARMEAAASPAAAVRIGNVFVE